MTMFSSVRWQFSTCLSLLITLTLQLGMTSKGLSQSIDPPPGQGAPSGTVGGGSRTSVLRAIAQKIQPKSVSSVS